MNIDFEFEPHSLDSLIGGVSVLDIPRLNVQSLDQARDFVRSYGYDLSKPEDEKRLWQYYQSAIEFIRSELLSSEEFIPEVIANSNQLRDLAYLLIYASTRDQRDNSLQRWACGLLRVIHVLVHLDNDLFTQFSADIQEQILSPFQRHVVQQDDLGIVLSAEADPEKIQLKKFYIKPFKSSRSSVIKLLAKPDEVAFALLDKIGVRFVTRHLFDVFRVMRFLLRHNLVSFPHVIPDQANNTLYPTNLFFEVMESLTKGSQIELHDLDKLLADKLQNAGERAKFKEKLNTFSGKDYRFVKFISRRLVRIQRAEGELSFFYPFEIQIVDADTFQLNQTGPASHDEYKKRQVQRARLRTFGPGPLN